MKANYLYIVLAAIVFGIGGFFGGMKYQETKRSAFTGRFGAGGMMGRGIQGPGGDRMGVRPVMGEIVTTDETSITVKTQDGSSKIILLSEMTTYSTSSAVTKKDLTVGAKVGIFGKENTDGSVTAQTVQLNPMFRDMGGSGKMIPTPEK